MRQLLHNSYFLLVEESPGGLYHLVRYETPFPTVEIVTSAWMEVAWAIDAVGRKGRRMLIDLRLVKGRNDPAFESAMLAVRPRVMVGLERIGVLVASLVGQLQIKRHLREDGIPRMISSSESELRRYLASTEPDLG